MEIANQPEPDAGHSLTGLIGAPQVRRERHDDLVALVVPLRIRQSPNSTVLQSGGVHRQAVTVRSSLVQHHLHSAGNLALDLTRHVSVRQVLAVVRSPDHDREVGVHVVCLVERGLFALAGVGLVDVHPHAGDGEVGSPAAVTGQRSADLEPSDLFRELCELAREEARGSNRGAQSPGATGCHARRDTVLADPDVLDDLLRRPAQHSRAVAQHLGRDRDRGHRLAAHRDVEGVPLGELVPTAGPDGVVEPIGELLHALENMPQNIRVRPVARREYVQHRIENPLPTDHLQAHAQRELPGGRPLVRGKTDRHARLVWFVDVRGWYG